MFCHTQLTFDHTQLTFKMAIVTVFTDSPTGPAFGLSVNIILHYVDAVYACQSELQQIVTDPTGWRL